jgi:hypothetical protein
MDPNRYISVMQNVFRSERLIYTALENTDEDKKFFHGLQLNPVSFGQSDINILRPQRFQESTDVLEIITKKSLICVKICLPKPVDDLDTQESKEKSSKDENEPIPIGFIFLSGQEMTRAHDRCSGLGVEIMDKYTGKGYGSEAINWIVDWGFHHANLHRITIGCFSYNIRAARLYEKLGFVPEARLRECYYFNREWHDDLTFGMLESDWERLRGIKKMRS